MARSYDEWKATEPESEQDRMAREDRDEERYQRDEKRWQAQRDHKDDALDIAVDRSDSDA